MKLAVSLKCASMFAVLASYQRCNKTVKLYALFLVTCMVLDTAYNSTPTSCGRLIQKNTIRRQVGCVYPLGFEA